ncbi:MAG TPA: hypothetical protein VF221_16535 [Chloroflexota bacterium]
MIFGRMVGRTVLSRVTGGRINKPNKMQALLRLPQLLRLGYALLRDDRVPVWQRASVLGLLGLIFSPVDIPTFIPLVGQFWDFTLSVVVLELFIQNAPARVVNEHILALGLEKKIPLRKV